MSTTADDGKVEHLHVPALRNFTVLRINWKRAIQMTV